MKSMTADWLYHKLGLPKNASFTSAQITQLEKRAYRYIDVRSARAKRAVKVLIGQLRKRNTKKYARKKKAYRGRR